MKIQHELIELVNKMIGLEGDSSEQANLERDQVREKIKLIGRTAAFFGGMEKLHDACEDLTGNCNVIGYELNRAWDGIGGWWA